MQGPNSFGPIPPGDLRAPSYQESVEISVDWATNWVLANTDRPVIAGGYSQGGEAASRFRMEFEDGGRLQHLRKNWVCGYAFGNPSRHLERTYYGGPATPFEGIAQFRLPQLDWDWCELIDPNDMYGTCMRGLGGEIQRDVYTMCTEMEMHSGAAEFCATFVANLIEVAKNLDGDAYDDAQRFVARHGIDLSAARLLPPERLNPLTDKLLTVSGIAWAIAAGIDALIFFCEPPYPTVSHCEYHTREVWPGQTYVGLAVQHVHDYVARLAVR